MVIVATTFDRSDVDGTRRMLKELYELFEKKTEIVLNKVLNDIVLKGGKDEVQTKIKDVYQAPILGIIPCFCDVLKGEGHVIFAQEKPEHPFTRILESIANKVEGFA
jgi:MinD-like ATPase involved in chromosome partitioning or flagellar assembly